MSGTDSAQQTVNPARHPASVWLQAVRAFSFTASIIPVLLGGLYALTYAGDKNWALLPLAVLGGLFLHAGTNLFNDYFDYKRGVDGPETYGSSRVLVDGLLPPEKIRTGGFVFFGLASAIGAILIYFVGWPIIVLGALGLFGGYLYTGQPIGYKYLAMGDVLVFFLMGPLMVIGGYLVVTGTWNLSVLALSVPIGLLVVSILHANNLRDRIHDGQAGIATVARLIGHRWGKVEYVLLVAGAYVAVGALAWANVLSPWTLLVLISGVPAAKNIALVLKSREAFPEDLATADVASAQVHMLFGVLLIAGEAVGAITG